MSGTQDFDADDMECGNQPIDVSDFAAQLEPGDLETIANALYSEQGREILETMALCPDPLNIHIPDEEQPPPPPDPAQVLQEHNYNLCPHKYPDFCVPPPIPGWKEVPRSEWHLSNLILAEYLIPEDDWMPPDFPPDPGMLLRRALREQERLQALEARRILLENQEMMANECTPTPVTPAMTNANADTEEPNLDIFTPPEELIQPLIPGTPSQTPPSDPVMDPATPPHPITMTGESRSPSLSPEVMVTRRMQMEPSLSPEVMVTRRMQMERETTPTLFTSPKERKVTPTSNTSLRVKESTPTPVPHNEWMALRAELTPDKDWDGIVAPASPYSEGTPNERSPHTYCGAASPAVTPGNEGGATPPHHNTSHSPWDITSPPVTPRKEKLATPNPGTPDRDWISSIRPTPLTPPKDWDGIVAPVSPYKDEEATPTPPSPKQKEATPIPPTPPKGKEATPIPLTPLKEKEATPAPHTPPTVVAPVQPQPVPEVPAEKPVDKGKSPYPKRVHRKAPAHLTDPNFTREEDEKAENENEEVVPEAKVEKPEEEKDDDDPDKLWCVCRKPHNNRFMIGCDDCEDWFHGKCVGVTRAQEKVISESGKKWYCPACRRKRRESAMKEKSEDKRKSRKNPTPPPTPAAPTSTSTESPAAPKKEKKKRRRSESGKSEEKIKEKKKRRHTPSPPAPSQFPTTPTPSNVTGCISCQKPARPDSVYCSSECVLVHARKRKAAAATAAATPPPPPKTPKMKSSKHKPVVSSGKSDSFLEFHPISTRTPTTSPQVKAAPTPTPTKAPAIPPVIPKKISKTDSRSSSQSSNKEPKKQRRRSGSSKVGSSKDGKHREETSVDSALVRDNMRKVIGDAFKGRIEPNSAPLKYTYAEMAKRIEKALVAQFGNSTNAKCMTRYRSIIFNIKDLKNDMYLELLSGRLEPSDLVGMESHQMANADLAKWRTQQNEKELDAIKRSEIEKLTEAQKQKLLDAGKEFDTAQSTRPSLGTLLGGPEEAVVSIPSKPEVKSVETEQSGASRRQIIPVILPPVIPTTTTAEQPPTGPVEWSPSVGGILETELVMPELGHFKATLINVSHNIVKGIFFPEAPVQMVGRINPETVWDYVDKLKKNKELMVFRLSPATAEDQKAYTAFYAYLSQRNRFGVLGGITPPLKDVYLIPQDKNEPINKTLLPFRGPGLPTPREHSLLAIVTRHTGQFKSKRPSTDRGFKERRPSTSTAVAPKDDDDEPYEPYDEQEDMVNVVGERRNSDVGLLLEVLEEQIQKEREQIQTISVAMSLGEGGGIPGLDGEFGPPPPTPPSPPSLQNRQEYNSLDDRIRGFFNPLRHSADLRPGFQPPPTN